MDEVFAVRVAIDDGDMEKACDERAIAGYDEAGRKAYAHTLLECASGPTLFASAFGGARVRTRIEHILSFRRMTLLSLLGFGMLTSVILFILLTNAA